MYLRKAGGPGAHSTCALWQTLSTTASRYEERTCWRKRCDRRHRAVVRRHAHILKDERPVQEEQVVCVGVECRRQHVDAGGGGRGGGESGADVHLGAGDGGVAEGGAQESDMRNLVVRELLGDAGGADGGWALHTAQTFWGTVRRDVCTPRRAAAARSKNTEYRSDKTA